MPDPEDFRVQNSLYHAEEVMAKHYGVSNYSDEHFDLVGKSLALAAEVNSRQVQANLSVQFNGDNPESLIRWMRQPDGSYKHDYTTFDRYLDMVARCIGKPRTLRLNCWGSHKTSPWGFSYGGEWVSALDPVTGRIERLKQPAFGTQESLAFWRPVFTEVLKKLEARGWLKETTLGYNSYVSAPLPELVDMAYKLWPQGEWSFTSHIPARGMKFMGSDTNVAMTVRHGDALRVRPEGSGLHTLDKPRRNTSCYIARWLMDDKSALREFRRFLELYCLRPGYDGTSEWGLDLFPLKKPAGGYSKPRAGRGVHWVNRSTTALLYPGPEGPVATERFEMFREGLELCEAMLFIRHAMLKKNLSDALNERIEHYLVDCQKLENHRGERLYTPEGTGWFGKRGLALERDWFCARYMQAEEDAKLLGLAGEVAGEIAKRAK
jgi:hypothetical protein